jgi:hypothetical protein
MKITKFGKIYEDEDGNLTFYGFHLEREGSEISDQEMIAALIIDRIKSDLEDIMSRKERLTYTGIK